MKTVVSENTQMSGKDDEPLQANQSLIKIKGGDPAAGSPTATL